MYKYKYVILLIFLLYILPKKYKHRWYFSNDKCNFNITIRISTNKLCKKK